MRNLVEIEHVTLTGALMKAAIARVTRKLFFIIFLGLPSVFSFGSSAWADSGSQNQDCSGDCEKVAPSGTNKRIAAFTPADPINVVQTANLSGGSDIRTTTPGSKPPHTDQGLTSAQGLVNPATEGGSTPGPRSFLLFGLVLIGVRLIISHRSRKVKNLATGTH